MSDLLHDAMAAALQSLRAHEAELGHLDAVAGDGDHGRGMVRGFAAALDSLQRTAGADAPTGSRLQDAAASLSDAAGGASGALWGAMLHAAGRSLTDRADDDAGTAPAAVDAALAAARKLGRAEVGDRTFIDALQPFALELTAQAAAGNSLEASWARAVPAAEAGAARTADLVARRGRAAALGERCKGHVDAGAQSLCLILTAIQHVLTATRDSLDG